MLLTTKQSTVVLRLSATGEELFGGPIIAELRLSSNKKHIRTYRKYSRKCQAMLGYMANHDLRTILQPLPCPATATA